MEVIGSAPDDDVDGGLAADADLDADASRAVPAEPAALRVALRALTCPEALGLSGVVVELLATGLTVPYLSYGVASAASQPSDGVDFHPFAVVGVWLACLAAAGLALGLLALTRLGRRPGAAALALAGAATIVGALMLVLSLWMLTFSVAPQPFNAPSAG